MRQNVTYSLFHHRCALNHLRKKHLALAKKLAHSGNALHKNLFHYLKRSIFLQCFINISLYKLCGAANQRVLQPLFHTTCTFRFFYRYSLLTLNQGFSILYQCISGSIGAVKHHIGDLLPKRWLYIIINLEHLRVYNGHVQPCLHRIVEKNTMHCLTHHIIASECKR